MNMLTLRTAPLLVLFVALAGCVDNARPPATDSGSPADTGTGADASTPTDTGAPSDGSTPTDTGTADDSGMTGDSGMVSDSGMTGDSGTVSDSGTADSGPVTDGGAASLTIEWVVGVGATPAPGVAVEVFDAGDLGTVVGTGTSNAAGVSAITFTGSPAGLYVAHATLAGHHDTWYYASDSIAAAPSVMGVPVISDALWSGTYSVAGVTETAGTGWIVLRGVEPSGAAAVDMTAATAPTGTVKYLAGGTLNMGTSSPDGEAIFLNAAPGSTVVTATVGTRHGMATVEARAGATVATTITLP